jgi:hypothetical protein
LGRIGWLAPPPLPQREALSASGDAQVIDFFVTSRLGPTVTTSYRQTGRMKKASTGGRREDQRLGPRTSGCTGTSVSSSNSRRPNVPLHPPAANLGKRGPPRGPLNPRWHHARPQVSATSVMPTRRDRAREVGGSSTVCSVECRLSFARTSTL